MPTQSCPEMPTHSCPEMLARTDDMSSGPAEGAPEAHVLLPDDHARDWRQRSILLRRQRHHRAAVRQQQASGRPHESSRRCRDASCARPACLFEDPPPAMLLDRETNKDGLPVDDIWASYAHETAVHLSLYRHREVVEALFSTDKAFQHASMRPQEVEALITSPEVRLAFLRFRQQCAAARLEPSRRDLNGLLISVMPQLQQALLALEDPGAPPPFHEHDGTPDWRGKLSLGHMAMHFLLRVEMWRRSQHGRFRDWDFGRREDEAASFLASVLLHMRLMDDEECFRVEEDMDALRWTELWRGWMREYPPLPESEAAELFDGDGRRRERPPAPPPPMPVGGRSKKRVMVGTRTGAGPEMAPPL